MGPHSHPPQDGLELVRPLVSERGIPGRPAHGARLPQTCPTSRRDRTLRLLLLSPQLQAGAGAPRGGPATSPPSMATCTTLRELATTSLRPSARTQHPPSASSCGEGPAATSPGSSWSWGPLWSPCRKGSSPSKTWGEPCGREDKGVTMGPGVAADHSHSTGWSACPTPAMGSRSHPLARVCGSWPSSWRCSWWSCGAREPTSW